MPLLSHPATGVARNDRLALLLLSGLALAIIPLDFTPQEISQDNLGSFAGPEYEIEAQRPSLTIAVPAVASVVEGSTTTFTAAPARRPG